MIDVQTYPVAHDKNGGGGGGKTYMIGGQSNVPSNLYVNSINASLGNIKHLTSTSLSSNDANFIYVTANDGNIYKLQGNDLDFYNGHIANLAVDCITADSLDLKNLSALKATIEELIAGDITTKNLTVTGTAHFFELIIDKIRSVGGQLILTPTSCIVDYVQYYNNGTLITNPEQYSTANSYDIYWRGSDPYGRAVNNEWIVNDQAICQSFNNAAVGTNNNVTNKYYWMLVNNKLEDKYINLKTGETTSQQNQTTYNTIYVGMWDTTWTENNNTHANQIEWNCAVQTIDDVPVSDVNWDDSPSVSGFAVMGTMKTSDKLFGIKITPTGDNKNRMTDKLKFTFEQETSSGVIPAPQMNITVTFTDDTFMYFPNVEAKKVNNQYVKENGHYVFELDLSEANNPISIITVVCAQDVDWHLCHGIRLNGIVKAENCAGYPEAGDNLIQLGWHSEAGQTLTDDQKKRQAAIIISAYNSPDPALKAPSYAHYQGINDFKLETHRGSYFDANGARFTGDITFANIGDLTATDKWMKLNYTSAPIISTMNEDGTRTTAPSTFGLSITSIDDREFIENSTTHEMENNPNFKKTVTYNAIPDGYSIFIYYYDKNGILNYNVPRIYSGDANYGDLSSITAPNAVEVQGNTKLVMKIVCKLVKGINANANVIDEIEIIYDEKDYWKTDSWCLIPEKEVAYATILSRFDQTGGTETANTQKVNLFVDLQYAAGHYKQGEISNVEFGTSSGLFLRARVYYQPTLADSASGAVLTEFQTNNITWSYTNDHIHGSFQVDNYLATLWPNNNNYQDYMRNYTDHRDKNPVMFEIELVDGRGTTDVVLDTRTVYVSLQGGAVMKIMQNAIVSAVASSKAYTDTTAAGLQTQINNNTSLITQTATNIQNWVSSNYATTGELGQATEDLESTIDQTAGMIRSEVKRSYAHSGDHLDNTNSTSYILDMNWSGVNENRYYRVTIRPTSTYTEKHRFIFQVERSRDSNYSYWGKPTYGSQDDPYGFDLMLNMTFITGSTGSWNDGNLYINEYNLQYSNGAVIGTVNTSYGSTYVEFYVRGGSKYLIRYSETSQVSTYVNDVLGVVTEPIIYTPTESSIEQTAERISMYVVENEGVSEESLRRTGIDIVSGKINLNADNTNINGNLNIYNANEGLQIYDSDNTPKVSIINKTLGSDPTDVTDYKVVSFVNTITLAPGVGTFDFANYSPAPYINLGEFKNGTIVTLSDFRWWLTSAVSDDGHGWYSKDVVSSTAYLRWTGPSTWSGSSNYQGNLPYLNGSFTADGSFETINFSEASGQVTGIGVTKYCSVTLHISGRVNYVSGSGVLVGKDGLIVSSSSGDIYSWIKSDNVILRNGDAIFRIKDGHIQRNDGRFTAGGRYDTEMGGTIFGDISSVVPLKIVNDTNYNVTNNDAFIVVSTLYGDEETTRRIYLPQPNRTPHGKIVYVKNISPNPCVVTTSSSNQMMTAEDNSPVSQINIENKSRMFLCDGWEWIDFYCG